MKGNEIQLGDIIQGWRVFSIQQAKAAARNPPDTSLMVLRIEKNTPGTLVPHRETKPAWYWADEECL